MYNPPKSAAELVAYGCVFTTDRDLADGTEYRGWWFSGRFLGITVKEAAYSIVSYEG